MKGLFLAVILISLNCFGVEKNANKNRCFDFYKKEMSPISNRGAAKLLLETDPKLHTKEVVNRYVKKNSKSRKENLLNPVNRVEVFVSSMQKIWERKGQSSSVKETVTKFYFDNYVIKPEQVPESYFKSLIEIERARGNGNRFISELERKERIEIIIRDQRKSLGRWLDYFLSPDSAVYPAWFKYWVLEGVRKASKFDAEKGIFGERNKTTLSPFPELNSEAVALLFDHLTKRNNGVLVNESLHGITFGKLYGHFLKLLKDSSFKSDSDVSGEWVKYPQGSDHYLLVESLQGKNTGWCTAGDEVAKNHLAAGDFWVYYSKDSEGISSIPRVAIRMEGKKIAEVRGVAESQNLDSKIASSDIVSSKLKSFGNQGLAFEIKTRNMKLLSEIEKKVKSSIPLDKEDLRFIYEIDSEIIGFGQYKDPRIEEIKSTRDKRSDLVVAFNYKFKPEEITFTTSEVMSGVSKVHFGDLDFGAIRSGKGIRLPIHLYGNLKLRLMTDLDGIVLPETIVGSLEMWKLESAKGLKLPKEMRGALNIRGLVSAMGLVLPDVVHGNLDLSGMTSEIGLVLPRAVKGSVDLNGLTEVKDLVFPETVNGSITLSKLVSAETLIFPRTVSDLNLRRLKSVKKIVLPEVVEDNFYFDAFIKNGKTVGLKMPRVGNLYQGPRF